MTISRYCASSLDAIRHAANAIRAGEGDTYIAAGVEWVSRYNERTEPAGAEDQNPNLQGNDGASRTPTSRWASRRSTSRSATRSAAPTWTRARSAPRSSQYHRSQEDGFFDREIAAGERFPDGTDVAKDDGPRPSSTLEKLAAAGRGVRRRRMTAGNSCPLNDGAAAVLLMSEDHAKELGLTPRAKIVSAATYANEPEYMGVAPIGAIKTVLDRAGMSITDIDVVELNEAFAAQVIPIMDECDIPI